MNRLAAFIIPAYLLIIVLLMIYFGRNTKDNLKNYALGGGQIPWFVTSGSMLASLIGGGTMIGYVGSYYQYGLEWAWMGIGIGIALLFIAFAIAPRIKNLNLASVPEIFSVRYDQRSRIVASLLIMIGDFAVFCGMISSFARIVSGYVGLDYKTAMIMGVILFILATFMGGFKGIAYTDLVQSMLIIAGVTLVGLLALTYAGGFSGISQLGPKYLDPMTPNIPGMVMLGNVIALVGMNFVSQSTVMQKVNATRSAKEAKKAVVVYAILATVAIAGFIGVMGLSARVLFGDTIANPDDTIIMLLGKMPSLLAAIYAAAIVAAVTTTANAMLMSSGLTFANDIITSIKPDISPKKQVLATRIYVFAAAVLGYIFVQFVPSVITWMLLAYTIQNALILPMYVGLMSKKISSTVGFASLLISGAGILIWELVGRPFNLHPLYIGLASSIIVLLLGGAIHKSSLTKRQEAIVDAFTKGAVFEPEKEY